MGLKMSHIKRFSMIEIIVISAVIGVMAAVLLPAVTKDKERANRTVCMSNHRQIGLALIIYTDDNNTAFPAK